MTTKTVRSVEVSGRAVEISSPDKVYFPALEATKFDLVSYYIDIADGRRAHRLRTSGDAPAVPGGGRGKVVLPEAGPSGAPGWLETTVVTTPNGTTSNALVVADVPTSCGR